MNDWQLRFLYKHGRMIETVIRPRPPRKLGNLLGRSRRQALRSNMQHGVRIDNIRRGLL